MINFRQYNNITKVVIPNNIRLSTGDFNNAFNNATNLVTSKFNHPNMTHMGYIYYNCQNLTGSPACGNNVIIMYHAY